MWDITWAQTTLTMVTKQSHRISMLTLQYNLKKEGAAVTGTYRWEVIQAGLYSSITDLPGTSYFFIQPLPCYKMAKTNNGKG